MIKRQISTISLLFVFCSVYPQVGINTSNPLGKFHIDAGKNNPSSGSIPATNQKDDFIVLADGKVGVGTTDPSVRIDARAADNSNSIIAIGYTDLSAAAAGKGALRYYDISGGILQTSDGVQWGNLPSVPTKSFVAVNISANNNTKTFTASPSDITGWNLIRDINSDFDLSSGIFTARRDGIYNVSFSYDFVQGSIIPASHVEAQIVKDPATILVKCLKTFAKSTREAQAGGICNSTVQLLKGEKLKVRLLQTIASSARGLRSTTVIENPFFGFNNLSIVEL